jgi:hypothetical protein
MFNNLTFKLSPPSTSVAPGLTGDFSIAKRNRMLHFDRNALRAVVARHRDHLAAGEGEVPGRAASHHLGQRPAVHRQDP